MTVTEIKNALGEWSLSLREDTPRELLDAIEVFGHLAVAPGRINPVLLGDNLLAAARYVGVYRRRLDADGRELSGVGMAFWLGDEDDKGDVLVNAVAVASASFADSIRAVLPPGGAVTEGTLFSIPGSGTFSSIFQYVTPRTAVTYITDTYSTELVPVSWRVNGDGTLDAGRDLDLFNLTPRAILVKRNPGRDMDTVGFAGRMSLELDVEDYTTKVVLLAEGEGASTVTASASQATTYNDIHGNDLVMTRLISEAETTGGNAAARAQLQLNRFKNARPAVDLSTDDYDVKGDFSVGDRIWIFDPDIGFTDSDEEVYWRGQPINPLVLPVVEMSWPVPAGWTVAFRRGDGVWLDLSDYYVPEGGQTTVKVGDFTRSLTGIGSQPIGTRPVPDSSVPATPVFTTPFDSASYQSGVANDVRAFAYLSWAEPLNTDGSTILDGDHYEIRYRATQTFNYPITWLQASSFTWDELQTWGRPLSNPAVVADQWVTAFVGWNTEQLSIPELMVSAEYEFQIRAVDNANPPNQSAWSSSAFLTTATDTLAPNQPAPPVVAASRIAIQVTHRLGDSGGGEFNLANDLHHLEVHVGGPSFYPDETTMVGKLLANAGNLTGRIPVVGTFQVENTSDIWVKVRAVDRFGNKSSGSLAAQSSVDLIDSAHISDLTASKITAGTIQADLLLAASIRTAESGLRAELNSAGLQLFDSNGDGTINLTAGGSGNYLAISDDLEVTLASIDSEGNIQGQVATFDDVVIAGDSYLEEIYPAQPRGLVAFGQITSAPPVNTTTSELGLFQLQFDAEAGRNYQVVMSTWLSSSVAGDVIGIRLRDGGDSDTVTIAGASVILKFSHGVAKSAIGESFSGAASIPFTEGRHQLLLSMYRQSGSGNVIGGFNAEQPAEISIIDTGPTVTNDAVLNDGTVSGTPVQTYTTTYAGTWGQTYNGSGSQKSGDTLDQGQYDSSAGNRRSLVGFDWAKIRSDLSGATIVSIKITLYAEHWYSNAGGTAVLGSHNYTAKPSTWTDSRVNQNRVTSSGWPKPGKRTVILPVAMGEEFRDGTTNGLAIGPGITTSTTYYGKFSGVAAATTGNRPVLTITYTK